MKLRSVWTTKGREYSRRLELLKVRYEQRTPMSVKRKLVAARAEVPGAKEVRAWSLIALSKSRCLRARPKNKLNGSNRYSGKLARELIT